MAEFPSMPLWTDAYLSDTTHLTTIEHGAYLLLLMAAWRGGGSLPDNDTQLARFARLTSGQWRRMSTTIRSFFTIEDGRLCQGRLTETMEAVRRTSQKQSDRARAKYRKTNNTRSAAAQPDDSRNDAIQNQTKETPSLRSGVLRATKKSKATRIPEDFRPDTAEAISFGLSAADAELEAANFLDYWRSTAKNGAKLDWAAAWRVWARKAVMDRRKSHAPATAKRQGFASIALELERELHARNSQSSAGVDAVGNAAGIGAGTEFRDQRSDDGQWRGQATAGQGTDAIGATGSGGKIIDLVPQSRCA